MARKHALWSASATARNWTCPGALAMATIAPPDKSSPHAIRGTAAHELAEECLLTGKPPGHAWHAEIEVDGHAVDVDDEMVEAVGLYVDYVRHMVEALQPADLYLERQFSLASLSLPLEAGGTCDAIICSPERGSLHVIDFKFGRWSVEASGNKQLRTYALGALLSLPPAEAGQIREVTTTIVQPRAAHADGAIRSESIHALDLMQWTSDLREAVSAAYRALRSFDATQDMAEWQDRFLRVGACDFCPAEGICPKRREEALRLTPAVVSSFVEGRAPEPASLPAPPNDLETLGRILGSLDSLEKWVAAVRRQALTLAEAGVQIPGYRLVKKFGLRKWKDGVGYDDLTAAGVPGDRVYEPKIISPAQAERIIGKAGKGKIAPLCEKPERGVALVPVNDGDERETTDSSGFIE